MKSISMKCFEDRSPWDKEKNIVKKFPSLFFCKQQLDV